MTRRRRAVLALLGVQFVLLVLGFVFHLIGLDWLALLAVGAAVMTVSLAVAVVWRRLAMQHAALVEQLRALTASAPAPRPVAPAAAPQPGSEFLIGRAAGVRQPVATSYAEQEALLFGKMTQWEALTPEGLERSTIAALGSATRYSKALPNEWRVDVEMQPGILESQAELHRPSLVLSESTAFSALPWRGAIDASGTWIIQDLQRLRRWADDQGALLVLFDHGDLPIGVNTAVIRSLFHTVVSGEVPGAGPEGTPIPAPLVELHRLCGLLAAQNRKASS